MKWRKSPEELVAALESVMPRCAGRHAQDVWISGRLSSWKHVHGTAPGEYDLAAPARIAHGTPGDRGRKVYSSRCPDAPCGNTSWSRCQLFTIQRNSVSGSVRRWSTPHPSSRKPKTICEENKINSVPTASPPTDRLQVRVRVIDRDRERF